MSKQRRCKGRHPQGWYVGRPELGCLPRLWREPWTCLRGRTPGRTWTRWRSVPLLGWPYVRVRAGARKHLWHLKIWIFIFIFIFIFIRCNSTLLNINFWCIFCYNFDLDIPDAWKLKILIFHIWNCLSICFWRFCDGNVCFLLSNITKSF